MFSIYNGEELQQWSVGNLLTNPHMNEGDMVRFVSGSGMVETTMAFKKDGVVVVDVPNRILTLANSVYVELVTDHKCFETFHLIKQHKPKDYVLIDNIKRPEAGNGGSTNGGVNITLTQITYEVSGGDVKISYVSVENNEIVEKTIDASNGTSGALSVVGFAGIHVWSIPQKNMWGDVEYPMVSTNNECFVGGSLDTIYIPAISIYDGGHLAITVV